MKFISEYFTQMALNAVQYSNQSCTATLDIYAHMINLFYRIRCCPVPLCLVPCKFGKILVVDNFVEKNYIS